MNERVDCWVEIYRSPRYEECQERALVLEALAIDYRLIHLENSYLLQVSSHDLFRAQIELTGYEAENKGWTPAEEPSPRVSNGITGVIGYCTILSIFFVCEQRQLFSLDWWNAGKTYTVLIHEGEIWRTVTALSLHADIPHLVGNLIFGSLFSVFVCQQLGTGLGWFSILLSGALGNFVNALIQPPQHMSVGASTAVFGALGILVALQRLRRSQLNQPLQRWGAVIVGIILLSFLGTGGANTDVLAHITGMIAGMLFGMGCGVLVHEAHLTARQQFLLAWITPLLLVLSWVIAFASFYSR